MPKRRLFDIETEEITVCKSPKVGSAKILIMKAHTEDTLEPDWEKDIVIKALDSEKQIAYGYVFVPEEEDADGDVISKSEVEKAAHNFMKVLSKRLQKGDGTGYEHNIFSDVGYAVESVVDRDGSFAKSLGVEAADIRPGGWFVGVRLNDEYWEKAKNGEITGFSAAGRSAYEDLEKAEKEDTDDGFSLQKLFKALKLDSKPGPMKKYKKATSYDSIEKALSYSGIVNVQKVKEAMFEKTYALWDSFFSIMDDDEVTDKAGSFLKSVEQYVADIKGLTKIEKNLNNPNGEEEMEELIKQLTKAVGDMNTNITGLSEKLDTISKAEPEPKPEDPKPESDVSADQKPDVTPEAELKKSIDALTSKVDDFSARLEKIESKPTDRQGADVDGDTDNTDLSKANGLENTAFSFRKSRAS